MSAYTLVFILQSKSDMKFILVVFYLLFLMRNIENLKWLPHAWMSLNLNQINPHSYYKKVSKLENAKPFKLTDKIYKKNHLQIEVNEECIWFNEKIWRRK